MGFSGLHCLIVNAPIISKDLLEYAPGLPCDWLVLSYCSFYVFQEIVDILACISTVLLHEREHALPFLFRLAFGVP